jgi:hypothetical protein
VRRVFEKYPNAEDRLRALVRPETPLIYTPAPAVPPWSRSSSIRSTCTDRDGAATRAARDFQVVDRATAMATTLEWLRAARVVPAHATPASGLPLVTYGSAERQFTSTFIRWGRRTDSDVSTTKR